MGLERNGREVVHLPLVVVVVVVVAGPEEFRFETGEFGTEWNPSLPVAGVAPPGSSGLLWLRRGLRPAEAGAPEAK